ncbi:type III secretion system (T3SS) SseB-like protein [Microterricola gilva]|uniref:Type III secretion system (T3SS) SseB-like protein n=1 Tax=Microterricola gilva TaxID=393267 RepID=A0A4Q8AJW4_9MICO|nr:SseB family protein [Microterricola gilva]RZU64135.1 type III secretion system (T3SS) SseB-like protein [Microterricola gilva]
MVDLGRPTTLLERAILRSSRQQLSMQSLLWILAASELIVPTTEDFHGNVDEFKPLLLAADDALYLAVFTHADQIGSYAATAPAYVTMAGESVLMRMPPGAGLIVNAGTARGFELPADGLAAIVDEITDRH